MLELLVSDDDRTFTLMATGSDGISCLAASGVSWETLKPEYGEPG